MHDLFQQSFLYQQLDVLSSFGRLDKEIPASITENLNPQFEIRDYQEEAFARFIYCFNEDFPNREKYLHLLFNMATGSGKTLIMAGLILYLYEKGYRNFLFYVNSNNIIKKTQDNFLNPNTSKHLFNNEIYIKGKRVTLTEVDNFDGVNQNDINICFTSIHQLHIDMTAEKENALTYENFANKKIVLLSDEAHHMNVSTRSRSQLELLGSWENTVERIFNSNEDNLLLEFTATHDYENPDMIEKYRNKVIYRYDLIHFRNDRFSKDIEIVRSNFNQQDRMLQAIILNHFKQRVAMEHKIQLKPVILFKAQNTIVQSRADKADFDNLIDGLTGSRIDRIRASEVELVQRAFRFFDERKISSEQLAQRLKSDFQKRYCLLVNSKEIDEDTHVLVNTLEDRGNPIRAIFAVKQLDEGWDVLNLFDIVRCYNTRDTKFNKPGSTTLSEAQLIGRGARYFPFTLTKNNDGPNPPENSNKFRRKFDEDPNHELRVLEELHYHSMDNNRYIFEISSALRDTGIIDETVVTRELQLKDSFKETDLYKYGVVWLNEREPRDYQDITSFADLADLTVKQKNHEHTIYEGSGGVTTAMEDRETGHTYSVESADIRLVDIEQNIVQAAIARNSFFTFASLKRYFPHLTSMHEFRTSENYLGGLAITFKGDLSQLEDNPSEKLRACFDLLDKIASELRVQITDYKGTTRFHQKQINAVFTDKTLKFSADNPRANEHHESEYLVKAKDWFAFNGLYGTSEEKAFVKMLNTWIAESEETYEYIYLLRNERHFALYNFSDGRTFEPDFVLYLGVANGDRLTYQLFIEPKGEHLEDKDRWKENFLKESHAEYSGRIPTKNRGYHESKDEYLEDKERQKEDFLKESRAEYQSGILTENRQYRVIGMPFYNASRENEFRSALNEALGHTPQTDNQDESSTRLLSDLELPQENRPRRQ